MTGRIRTGATTSAKSRAEPLDTTVTWSLLRELNPDHRRTEAACCRYHQAGAVPPPAIRAAPRCRSGPPALQERGRSRARRRSTPAGTRTRINLALNQARLPDCGTSAQSRHPVPTRIT